MNDLQRITKILEDQGKKNYEDFTITELETMFILTMYKKVLVAFGAYDEVAFDFIFDLTGKLIEID